MSDSEDEAAFASADEGQEDKAAGDVKDKVTVDCSGQSGGAVEGAAAGEAVTEAVKESGGQGKAYKKKGKKGAKKNISDTKKSDSAKPQPKASVSGKGKAEKSKSSHKKTGDVEIDVKKKDDQKAVEKDSSNVGKKMSGSEDVNTHIDDSISKEAEKSVPKAAAAETTEAKDSKPDVTSSSGQSERTSVTPDKTESLPAPVESPDSQNIPRSVEDVKEPEPNKEESEQQSKEAGGWGWGGWGSSILSAASSSVTTFTSQVGEGLTTLVESMETTLGAPPPEEIARINQEQNQIKGEETLRRQSGEAPVTEQIHTEPPPGDKTDQSPSGKSDEAPSGDVDNQADDDKRGSASGWFSGVSSLTSKIQDKGKSLVSGSLDAVEAMAAGGINVLENIGKKTIDVLSDHDPGFKTTKVVFGRGKKTTNLSSLLREAKEKQEAEAVLREEQDEARKHNYGAVFDDYQGLAHLEALEILSNQSEKKVQSLLSSLNKETMAALKPELLEIKAIFELDDSDFEERQEHDFSKLITDHLSQLHLGTTPDKLNKVQQKTRKWIIDFYTESAEGEEKKMEPKEICHAAIDAMAELTAKSVEQFHKAGELVLMQQDSDITYKQRSQSLASLTHVLCTEISILSTKFSQCLHKLNEDLEDKSVVTPLVTNVFLEASNSSTYIQDGFQLLLPVLQQATIQNSKLLQS